MAPILGLVGSIIISVVGPLLVITLQSKATTRNRLADHLMRVEEQKAWGQHPIDNPPGEP
jgi:hypothetical protein